MLGPVQLLTWIALASGALAAAILLYYLLARPPLQRATKLWLLMGLGPLPIASAMMGNVANLEVSKERRFCGSCHVMTPHVTDAADPKSRSLAAIHSRNAWFGDESCYVCHADYGMFGVAVTKIGGLHHVWDFYTKDWGPGARKPKLYKPYSNDTCARCHPQAEGHTPLAHRVHAKMLSEGGVSCAAAGCHGPPHPTGDPPAPVAEGAPPAAPATAGKEAAP